MKLNDLSTAVGVSVPNLSVLKTGKEKAIRFSTLEAICKVLDCQPGDILEFRDTPGAEQPEPSDDTPDGKRLLSDASLRKLHTADSRSITDDSGEHTYGFGWRHVATPLGDALAHEGAFGGFYSRIVIVPSSGLAMFSVANELSEAAANAQAAFTNAILTSILPGDQGRDKG